MASNSLKISITPSHKKIIACIDTATFCIHNKSIQIEFDQTKRDKTLQERGLDFSRAGEVFSGPVLVKEDVRFDYGEPRFITFGWLDYRLVVLVWTPRGEVRHYFHEVRQ